MPTVAIIQARLGSSRLPGKVLRPLLGYPMLGHIVRRVGAAKKVGKVVVATSDLPGDEPLRAFCAAEGIACFAGSERDVLDRFYQTALLHRADPVVRITADCPLADPALIDAVIAAGEAGGLDHIGVAAGAGAAKLTGGRFPAGLDAEFLRFSALETAWREAVAPTDREHVTPFIWRQPERFRLGVHKSEHDYSHLRWTVDYEADFEVVAELYAALYRPGSVFGMQDVLDFLSAHPELASRNAHHISSANHAKIWQPAESGTKE